MSGDRAALSPKLVPTYKVPGTPQLDCAPRSEGVALPRDDASTKQWRAIQCPCGRRADILTLLCGMEEMRPRAEERLALVTRVGTAGSWVFT